MSGTTVPDPPCVAMLICGVTGAVAGKGDDPTLIHRDAQPQHLSIKPLGAAKIVGGNIGNDPLYGHALSNPA
jgi:hypothetical protein